MAGENKTNILITAEDKTKAAIASASAGLDSLTAKVPALGAALSTAGFAAYVKGAIDAADQMQDLSQRIGISIDKLGAWKLASEQSGTSMESIARGVKGLSKYIVENSDKLKAAGITATDANGAMTQLADLFSAMPDGIQKTALATQIFGKAGMDLIPMLNLGSKGLAESAEKSAIYSKALAALAPNADKFNDQLGELALNSKATAMNIAGPMMDGLIGLTQVLIDITTGGEKAKQAFEWMSEKSPMFRALLAWHNMANTAGALAGFGGGGSRSSGGRITGLRLSEAEELALGNSNAGTLSALGAADRLLGNGGAAGAKSKYARDFDPAGDYAFAIEEARRKALRASFDTADAEAEKARLQSEKAIETLGEHIDKINEETFALTASAEQLRDHTILLALQKSGLDEGSDAWTQYGEKMRVALGNNEIAKIAHKAREDSERAWEKFTDQIEQSLTDSLMRGFENGKGFGKNFVDSLKNTLKTAALKVVVQALVDPVMGGIRGALGGSVGAGGTPSGGLFGTATTLGNAFSAGSSLYNFATGNVGGGAYGAFAGSSIGQSLGLSQGTLMGPTLDGGALGGTALTSLGTAMPYIAAAIAAYSLLSSKGGGPKTEGGYNTGAGGLMPSQNQMGGAFGSTAQSLVEGVASSYNDILGLFGKKGGTLTGGAFVSTDPNGTANTQLFQTESLNGQLVYDRNRTFGGVENVGRSDAELQSAIAQSSALALIAALEATDGLPQIVEKYLDSIKDTKLTAEQAAAAINQVKFYDQLLDAVNIAKSFEGLAKADTLAGLSEFNRFLANTDDLRTMAEGFDGSLNSAAALATATNSMYTDQLSLVRQIKDAAGATHSSFSASARGIGLDVLDNQGKYNFYNNEAEKYRDVLKTLTDPALISDYADRLNTTIMAAWGVLDPNQRTASAGQFQGLLGEADTLAQGRYSTATSQVESMSASLTATIQTAFAAAIDKAVTAITAAKSPITLTPLDVNLNVTTNTAARTELVSYSGGTQVLAEAGQS